MPLIKIQQIIYYW